MKWKLLPDICITGDDTSFLFLWHIFKSVASMETVSPDAKTITYFVKEFNKTSGNACIKSVNLNIFKNT